MALPTLDATFASSADLPRKQMLAKWLVEELGETQAPSSIVVSGAGSDVVNGTYTYTGVSDGKPYYNLPVSSDADRSAISWLISNWVIWGDGSESQYSSTDDVEFPWQVTTWIGEDGGPPMPTVTEIPSQNPIANYYDLPERYLWAKIAVAAGGPREEAAYISLPKNYVWSDIYNAVAGDSGSHIDWTEKQALGHIAAAYRGDTENPEALATYIDWPWRYQVASIIDATSVCSDADAGVLINGNFLYKIADKYYSNGTYEITYGSGQWFYEESGVATLDVVTSSEEYPWLAGLGEKDCFARFSNLPNAVIVSGAGTSSSDGTYVFSSVLFSRPAYTLNSNTISWDGGVWYLYDDSLITNTYASQSDVLFPWDGTWVVEDADGPPPTLTATTI